MFQNDFREDDDGEEDTDAVRDLSDLPPEVALSVLSHLNATDLCLAACVWQQLASDEILWNSKWTFIRIIKLKKYHGIDLDEY